MEMGGVAVCWNCREGLAGVWGRGMLGCWSPEGSIWGGCIGGSGPMGGKPCGNSAIDN